MDWPNVLFEIVGMVGTGVLFAAMTSKVAGKLYFRCRVSARDEFWHFDWIVAAY